MFVTKRNGNIEEVHFDKITSRINKLVKPDEKKYIDPTLVAQKVVGSIFSGITTEELDNESAKICINLCTSHHLYSMLAGRIVVSNLHKKTINTFVEKEEMIQEKLGFLEPKWLAWIKENRYELNTMIDYERDYLFDYFGFKTLERAYLTKIGDQVIERPQDMLMRVASFINCGDLELVKKTYDMISQGLYTHASPTLFNAGNQRSQMSSCYLLGTDDSLDGITKTWADVAKISKWGGGIGLHVSNIRAKDTMIKGTNGPSSGIIPMLKVYNEIARYIDQCFIGSTKVYTQRGLIPIEEIKPNDKVFTQDGSLQEVEKVYCDKYENKILNFKIFHDYESIKVTPTHPFYVVKNQPPGTNFSTILKRLDNKIAVPEWIDAKNITTNDLIGFPIPKYVLDNRNLDEADCYMYGLMLGASSCNEDRNEGGITLGFKKDAVICFVREYLKTNGIHFWETITESTIQIRWTTSSKFKFVRAQLYDINSEKHIDESMLHLPEDKSKWIIKGVLDTDGCIGKGISSQAPYSVSVSSEQALQNSDEITLEMTSQNVIDGVKYLILRMGILCSGYSRDRIGNVSTYKFLKEPSKLTWVLRIPKAQKIAKLLDIEAGQFFKFIAHNDILYTRLKEVIEEDIVASVYDLEIKNNHNYLTQAGLVHNGGKRKGSIAIYLEPHHPDVLAFLELKKNFGAETERARDLFLAMWLSDVFMKQVEKDGDWYLICPDKCPGLTDAYGEDYEKLYWSYVEAKKYNSVVKARQVMKAILDSQLETGTPYIGFKDNINNKSNQKNIGTIKSSNLCVHEDTMILTDQGYKNIKLLKDSEVNIWNGEQWSKVTVKQTGTNQNLVRVNLSNGVSLDCTPEHKFYIQEGFSRGNIIETEASKLKIDNKLIKFNLPPAIEFENPTEFKYAYTHGAFCGDGTTYDNYSKTKKYPKLYLYGAKKDLLQYIDYQSYTENTNADRYDITLPKDLNPKFMIPENASINTRLRWFEGYCDTDGTIARNSTLQIGSTNKDFLSNIRLMLHTLGIESKVTKNYDERLTIMPDHKGGAIFRLLVGSNDLYHLSLLGFSPKRLKYTPRIPQRNATQFVKVTSVEESYKNVDTYCFTEPLKHMGVFNGVLTGQCIEIVEYSDASEYAVCNLASIAINKCVEPFANKKLWTIYTKDNCKFCQWTKSYLMNNGYFFHEEYVDSDKLKEITGLEKPTYPQIYYGDQYVGGYSDFFQFTKSTFNYDKLYEIAYLATINLNKIIDINYYPVIEAKRSNIRHRPIAVGIQGLADALVQLKICFDSDESLEFNAKMMETIYLACLTASCNLSEERENKLLPESIYPEFYDSKFDETNDIYHKLKPNTCELGKKFPGAYSTFEGSPISQGQFQFDMWSLNRNKLHFKEKWLELEERIKKYGVRNSLVTALMPTASTSQILGNNECFEFFTNNIYTRRTLAGDFPLVNKYLIDELNNIGLWSTEMKQMILANNGSIANFSNIPEQIRNLYKTIWEIKQIWVLKNTAARGPFVDQTQSMNIFMAVPDYQKLYSSHFWAWSNGLKTGIYYLRSRAAKDAVKVTVDPSIQKKLEQITNDDHEVCENCSA
jgi:ribonucleoside-diphosphate reductase alpha chain